MIDLAATIAGFEAARRVQLWRHRLIGLAAAAVFAVCLVTAAWISDFSPGRVIEGLPRIGGFFEQAFPHLESGKLLADTHTQGSLAYWFFRWDTWLWLILETIEMAILGTALGGAAALLLSFFAARNIAPNRLVAIVVRRLLELFRTLPDIVVALLFVFAFGLGPAAGVLAIGLHTTGALGKLMSEVHENIDMGPVEGVRASGGNWPQIMRFAVTPQILPNFLSYLLLRFEINVASASAIGFVGAGGIGQEFFAAIQQQYFPDALAIMLMVVLGIMAIDLTSEFLRHRLIGIEAP